MQRSMILSCTGLVLALCSASASASVKATTATTTGYAVVQRWKPGGAGGWDYLTLDATTRRLFVSRADRVMVLDADSGKSVGEIAPTDGVHGIALAPELNRGFTSNGRANSVSVFDLKTLKPVEEIKIDGGQNPDAIVYDAATQRVFTFNGRSANATAIDAKTGKIAGTITLSGKPEFAVSDGHGRIFVNIEDKAELTAIDSKALKVQASWKLAGCEEPTGLAFDAAHQRLFSVCQNRKMLVLDAANGKQVASVAIGEGPDAAAFDADRQLVFSSNGDGTLTVIHEEAPDKYRIVENVTTQKSARTLAFDPKTHRVLLAAAEFGPAPAATKEQPHPRPPVRADSFTILVVGD